MQKIKGKYAEAVIFSDHAEKSALDQVRMICNLSVSEGSKIRLMPNISPGKVGPNGLTMNLGDKFLPVLVGTDIGCGVSYIQIKNTKSEYQKLERIIRETIPTGSKIRSQAHHFSQDFDFRSLRCRKHLNEQRALCSLGTLGSGNDFIELDVDSEGNQYVFVHSGSRGLGREVSEYYLREGQKRLAQKGIHVPYELTWLEGDLLEDYLHDANEVMGFAILNREILLTELEKQMGWKVERFGESIHNYVDENRILRNGAVQAYEGDEVILSMNMRDGMILGTGKGNEAWNCSAPCGAERIFRLNEILQAVEETMTIEKVLQPVYRFQAAEKG